MYAICIPRQVRDPAPKGVIAALPASETRFLLSASQRSGRNSSGGSKSSGSRCMLYACVLTMLFCGRKNPPRSMPPAGTTRGKAPGAAPHSRNDSSMAAFRSGHLLSISASE
ncbi:unnamed protein product [Cercospora beticola]|nr:unnamed protein product [Cercospora beticola]